MKNYKWFVIAITGFSSFAVSAFAEGTRSVKFESTYNKRTKGAVCQVVASGKAFEVTTPARIKLPLEANGQLKISKLSCDLQGIKRQTGFFPDEVKFDREIYGISVNFKDKDPAFSYLKKNGGLAVWFSRDGKWVPVK